MNCFSVRPSFLIAALSGVASIGGCSAQPPDAPSDARTIHSRVEEGDDVEGVDPSVDSSSDGSASGLAAEISDPAEGVDDANSIDPPETADGNGAETAANGSVAAVGHRVDDAHTGGTNESANPVDPGETPTSTEQPAGPVAEPPGSAGPPTATSTCATSDPAIDWSNATVLAQATGQGPTTLRVFDDGAKLHVCVEGELGTAGYSLLFDCDGSPVTGESQGGWGPNGADFLVENGFPHKFVQTSWTAATGAVEPPKRDANVLTVVVSKAAAELTANFMVGFRLLLDGPSSSEARIERLPTRNRHFARLSLPPSATSGGGMIIPIYTLPPGIVSTGSASDACKPPTAVVREVATDAQPQAPEDVAAAATIWKRLADAAATMRDSGGYYKDFWVAVSGPGSRPFKKPEDFATAARVYDPIVNAGGKIFGYVHARVQWCKPQLRSIEEVLSDVDVWVANYQALSGIWLDEYYPLDEYSSDGTKVDFPNGSENAAAEIRWASSVSTTKQMDPTGGYYQRLTDAIRSKYPSLKLIGNAGAPLSSNQLRYGALTNVMCGFEQTEAVAKANNWAGLTQATLLPDSPALFALVHTLTETQECVEGGACPTLTPALDRAIGHGYSYFFATDGKLNQDLWLGLPPYFEQQVKLLTQRGRPTLPINE